MDFNEDVSRNIISRLPIESVIALSGTLKAGRAVDDTEYWNTKVREMGYGRVPFAQGFCFCLRMGKTPELQLRALLLAGVDAHVMAFLRKHGTGLLLDPVATQDVETTSPLIEETIDGLLFIPGIEEQRSKAIDGEEIDVRDFFVTILKPLILHYINSPIILDSIIGQSLAPVNILNPNEEEYHYDKIKHTQLRKLYPIYFRHGLIPTGNYYTSLVDEILLETPEYYHDLEYHWIDEYDNETRPMLQQSISSCYDELMERAWKDYAKYRLAFIYAAANHPDSKLQDVIEYIQAHAKKFAEEANPELVSNFIATYVYNNGVDEAKDLLLAVYRAVLPYGKGPLWLYLFLTHRMTEYYEFYDDPDFDPLPSEREEFLTYYRTINHRYDDHLRKAVRESKHHFGIPVAELE